MIADEFAAGRDVAIAGFGKFSVAERAAREGRKPATGGRIRIAASPGASYPRRRA
jgi:DNA-binding protein HU-beta